MARKPSRGEAGERTHPCATTTPQMRRAIQASEEKNVDLAKWHGVTRRTIGKWRWRESASDEPMGPKNPRPRLLSEGEDAIILAYRWRTRLPLDACHARLKRMMPKLTRPTLFRCLKRYGLSKIGPPAFVPPLTESALRGLFTFEIIAYEVVAYNWSRRVFLAIEEVTKEVFAQVAAPTTANAATFVANLAAEFPQKVVMVTTNASEIFTEWPGFDGEDLAPVEDHPFAAACRAKNIQHTRTLPPPGKKSPNIHSPSVVIREQSWALDRWTVGIPV